MYLSRLDIHGFKSFATPTVFHFDPGITAIVGPNGCGKSNVVDAIRWVIGEQRARILRSDKMDGIIFNGTAGRRGLGMAEVRLTVQNTRGLLPTEFSEVTLGRRLYRSGDSEYLLNGTSCRLRDIVDLFLDTGMGAGAYSVIELKMVEDILSESTQDRRRLFEEAAGITKYKLRRQQALRKLDGLQADLARVQDLQQEVERRVARLDRQAKAAAHHQVLSRRARELSLALAAMKHNRLSAELSAVKVYLERARDALTRIVAESGSHEAVLQARRKSHIDYEKGLVRSEGALADHLARMSEIAVSLRLARERHATAMREITRAEGSQEEALVRKTDRETALKGLREALHRVQPKRTRMAQVLEEAKEVRDAVRQELAHGRRPLVELSRDQAGLAKARAAHLRRYDQVVNRIELATQEVERMQAEADQLKQATSERQARLAAAGEARVMAERALHHAQQAVSEAEKKKRVLQDRIAAAEASTLALLEQRAARQAEATFLEAVVSGYEGFPEATRFLAGRIGTLRTISDVLVTDGVYRKALGAVLGPLGACVVVESVEEVQRAVALLRKEEKGCGLFVTLDRIPEDMAPTRARSGVRPLLDVVSVTDPAYTTLARLVLQGVYYADDSDAVEAARGPLPGRLVTPSGEWVDGRGFLQAGSQSADTASQHMDRRARLADTHAALAALRTKHNRHKKALAALKQQQDALGLSEKRQRLTDARHAVMVARNEETRQGQDLEALVECQTVLASRMTEIARNAELMTCEAEEAQVAAAAAKDRLDTLKAQVQASREALALAEVESSKAEDRYAAAALDLQNVCNDLARIRRDVTRVEGERVAAEEQAETLARELKELTQNLGALARDIAALEAGQSSERKRRTSLDEAVREAKTHLMENRVATNQIEAGLRKLRRAHDEAVREEREYAVRSASLVSKMEEVAAMAHEKYGVDLSDELIPGGEDQERMRKELETIQTRLRAMGSVNALALQEYEQERERHAFMVAQWEDLKKAEATLLETTEEINRSAARQFRNTFATIRENFRKLFGELFGGNTRADLVLTETGDLLESPIDITAQPRGKRPIGISQLSSGEKTLTAIALLFAIYQVKPSPFCFLDEVDAPLDEANIERFMRLIRRFSIDTQFVLVTHNKRTMEMADRLYGITMQEEGVSRLVGVRFEEAMAMAA